jgi:hypothetical protein
MPPEYEKGGQVSEKTDSYAFSILLLELLTGKVGLEAAAVHFEEPDRFGEMQQHTDARAGAWPPAAVAGLAAVAERCICMHARTRASVREVVAQLDALLAPPSDTAPPAPAPAPAAAAAPWAAGGLPRRSMGSLGSSSTTTTARTASGLDID